MSIFSWKNKVLGHTLQGGDSGGGGGGGGATQSTSYNTNIPEYARPYVENMLQSTQAQIYNPDMTSFRAYQPYSTDVNNYFAGFSPLQQQAQSAAANMQNPSQFGLASGMAGRGGLNSMAVAGQAAGAGGQYAQMAQDPNAIRGYMSPYMQNVVDYQKSQALRDYNMGQPMMQAKAVGQGAFGGNRLALQQAEAQRGLMSQLQGIEATGAQNAFQNAQQAQQFGANLGLQGQQTALQGYGQGIQAAGQLGQLGSAQQAADINRINLQSQLGGQQQQLEQNKINQAIQNYAVGQQYPMMQLGLMSNMLRGLPLQAQTTQLYQAQPSTTQQAIGLLGAGSTLFGRKEGGMIKEMAEGGVAGYKYGGAIPEAKLASMADNLSVDQLKQRLQDPQLDSGERQIFADALQDKAKLKARSEGIAAAGGGLFNTMGYAGGGILAFADEGEVKDPEELANQINLVGAQLDAVNKEAGAAMGPGSKQRAFRPEKVAEYENLKKRQNELKTEYADLMTKAGLDKPAIGYRSGVAPTTLYPNSTEQAVLGTKPPAPSAQPTAGEFQAFDEATQRFLAEQKAGAKAGPATGGEGSKAYGAAGPTRSGGVGTGSGSTLGGILANLRKEGPQGELGADYLKTLEAAGAGADERLSKAERMAQAKGWLKFGATPAPGGIMQAGVAGLTEYADAYAKALESDEKFRAENARLQNDVRNLRRAEERGDVKLAAELEEKIADRQARLQAAQISAAASHSAGAREEAYVRELMKGGMSLQEALQAVKGAGRVESNDITRAKVALAQINEQLLTMKKDDPSRAALIAQRDQITQALASGSSAQTASTGVPKDIQGILNKYQ